MSGVEECVLNSILEYNKTILKSKRAGLVSNAELCGIFYTTLRRSFTYFFVKGVDFCGVVKMEKLVCTFRENGELESFRLIENHNGYGRSTEQSILIHTLNEIGKKYKSFDNNFALMKLSSIIQSIKS